MLMAAMGLSTGSISQAAGSGAGRTRDEPEVKSVSVLVLDGSNSTVVFARKVDAAMPIASITKLMTALVILDGKQPLDELIEITKADRYVGKNAYSRIPFGAKLTRGDLLCLALMSSENRAAQALGRNYPGGLATFVRTMNLKARALGMTQTHFVDPAGLSSDNVASARDLTKLVIAAGKRSTIREYSTCRQLAVRIGRKMMEFHNTNSLVSKPDWDITVQKTGYIVEAGQCLVMQVEIESKPVIIVLLNSYGKYTRVADAKRIRQWMADRPNVAVPRVAGKA